MRAVEADLGFRLHVNSCGKHAAVLMVGMVAADFGAAGCGKVIKLFHHNTSVSPGSRGQRNSRKNVYLPDIIIRMDRHGKFCACKKRWIAWISVIFHKKSP